MLQYKPVDTMVICVSFHSAGRIQFLFLNNIFPGLTIVSLSDFRSVIMALYLFSSQRTMHLHYFSIIVLECAEYVLSMLQPKCCSMSEYVLMNMLNIYIALCINPEYPSENCIDNCYSLIYSKKKLTGFSN